MSGPNNPLRLPDDIPADMRRADRSAHGGTVVSIRDLLVLLGASDDVLRDCDERADILAREPWRKDSRRFVPLATLDDGTCYGVFEGDTDWSGTRFEDEKPWTLEVADE